MTFEKFNADDTALLLIDHQVGTMGWVKSIPQGNRIYPRGRSPSSAAR